MDTFDFETAMTKHLFDGHQIHNSSSNSSDFFLCDEYSSDSDMYDGFNSDQENNEDKLYVPLFTLTPFKCFFFKY